MEIKEAIKRVSLANDINLLSLQELADKYLKSKTSFDRFLKDFEKMFVCKTLYQLRVNDKYNKISELINYGYLMYPSDRNEIYTKRILSEINLNLEDRKTERYYDSVQQSLFLFLNTLGADKCKHVEKYDQIIKGMDRAVKKYEGKNNKSLYDFPLFLNTLRYKVNPAEFDESLSYYISTHPLIKECKDIYFLYFANYVLAKCNEVDPVFIQDVKDVIEVSKTFDRYVIRSIENNKDYKKVAKLTLKNIKKYENNLIDKEEDYSRKLGK